MHAMLHNRKFQIRQRLRGVTSCEANTKDLLESFRLLPATRDPQESIVGYRDVQSAVPTEALEQQETRMCAGKKGEMSKCPESKVIG